MQASSLINGNLVLLLYVRDVEESIAFYRDKLGFLFKGSWDEERHEYVTEWTRSEKPPFAELVVRDLIIHLHVAEEEMAGVVPSACIFHLEVADVDGYHREVTARGLPADEPQDMPWGWRQFYVSDPDGHRWSFRNPTTAGIAP